MVETLYTDKTVPRIEQGDLIEGLHYNVVQKTEEEITFNQIFFPYTIVVTQDCDLEQDFNQHSEHEGVEQIPDHDKYLGTICLLPAYTADSVRFGTHLQSLNLSMKTIDRDRWKPLKQNQVERFHYIHADPKRGIPDLVIDFKHTYTISRMELYNMLATKPEMRRFRIVELFREDLSFRFANFLSRVALPIIKIPDAAPAEQ
jgi:hypothetical protein